MKLKKIIAQFYFRIKSFFSGAKTGLYTYTNYEEYKQTQIEGNIKKIDRVWASEEDMKMLSKYLQERLGQVRRGICHGTRRGLEQKWFRAYTGADVIGTEISPTAVQFKDTIQWDFHDVKDEWIGNMDFIYSNSFDHSYKPAACLDAWMSCLTKQGVCILEWSNGHVYSNKLDPFGSTRKGYIELANNKYQVVDILKGTGNRWYNNKRSYFVVVAQRN